RVGQQAGRNVVPGSRTDVLGHPGDLCQAASADQNANDLGGPSEGGGIERCAVQSIHNPIVVVVRIETVVGAIAVRVGVIVHDPIAVVVDGVADLRRAVITVPVAGGTVGRVRVAVVVVVRIEVIGRPVPVAVPRHLVLPDVSHGRPVVVPIEGARRLLPVPRGSVGVLGGVRVASGVDEERGRIEMVVVVRYA